MKVLPLFIATALLCATHVGAQTKKVEHRSHSGSNKTFTVKGNSNFGVVIKNKEEFRRVDSLRKVKYVQDSIAQKQRMDSINRSKGKKVATKKK